MYMYFNVLWQKLVSKSLPVIKIHWLSHSTIPPALKLVIWSNLSCLDALGVPLNVVVSKHLLHERAIPLLKTPARLARVVALTCVRRESRAHYCFITQSPSHARMRALEIQQCAEESEIWCIANGPLFKGGNMVLEFSTRQHEAMLYHAHYSFITPWPTKQHTPYWRYLVCVKFYLV